MGATRLYLAAAVCVVMVVAAAASETEGASDEVRAPPEVTIASGALSGKWKKARGGRDVAAFEGVPYAAPPLGELRFQPPQPVEPWAGVRPAAQPGSACTQRNIYLHKKDIEGQEDCLYLNVYAPEGVTRDEPLPVLFWIHGGGWLAGEGRLYEPDYLLDKDVLLVTFNYRLGPLGFLSTSDEVVPGNMGLKDMVFALRWVRDNIRAFGGDPGSVTVFGESAGGAATHLFTLSPLTKGLFHRALAMSGNALTPWAFHVPGEPQRHARVLAEHTQCPAAPSEAFVACLRAKTAEELVAVDHRFMQWDIHPHMPFKATVEPAGDGAFLDVHPREAYGAGYLHDVPYMTGITAQDGVISVGMLLENDTALEELSERFSFIAGNILTLSGYPEFMRKETMERVRRFYFGDGAIGRGDAFNLIAMATDAMFLYPTLEVVKLNKKHSKAAVFLFEFAHLSQSYRSFAEAFGAPSPDYGVCHCDDLIYLFPFHDDFPGDLATDDLFVSRKFVDYVVHFARNGRPTADRSWQAVAHPDSAEYMHIGSPGDIQMRANMAPERMALWSEVPIRLGRAIAHDEL